MTVEKIETRLQELANEYKKGAEALEKLQNEANKIQTQMQQIKGAYIELENQKKELDNGGKKEGDKKSACAKKGDKNECSKTTA